LLEADCGASRPKRRNVGCERPNRRNDDDEDGGDGGGGSGRLNLKNDADRGT